MSKHFLVRTAVEKDFATVGQLMIEAYSTLEGFFTIEQFPAYYNKLAAIGDLTEKPGVEILMATDGDNNTLGAVVYFKDLKFYGAPGTITKEKDAAGFRFLAVSNNARGLGLGKLLTQACIDKAKSHHLPQLVIHSTDSMKTAISMYERMGFQRSTDLDFMQGDMPVFGFRLKLN